VHDHGQNDSHDEESDVMEDCVAEKVSEGRVAHHILAKNTNNALAEENRRVEWVAGNYVNHEEPDSDGGGADETRDHAFTQKIVVPLSHSFS